MFYRFVTESGVDLRIHGNSVADAVNKLTHGKIGRLDSCIEAYNLTRGSKIPLVYVNHLIKRFNEVSKG